MEFFYAYGLFLLEAVTIVAAILVVVGGILALSHRQHVEHEGHIEVKNLNEHYEDITDALSQIVLDEAQYKKLRKAEKKHKKAEQKEKEKVDDSERKRLYVLEFDGDIKAAATENLREEISAVLSLAREQDEILLKLESPGGMVHSYGLAASQLQRIVDAGIALTVVVDKVAASGGYMMACVGNRIIAAPFAIIGSIGVLAQLPNFHRLLKKHDIDYEQLTAGEYKRTLSMFGENTDKGREKFMEELEDTHLLFKQFVSERRPQLDIDKVATGEIWYGQRALEQGLVDDIATSDSVIQAALAQSDIYSVSYVHKKSWQEKLGMAAESALEGSFLKIWQRGQQRNSV